MQILYRKMTLNSGEKKTESASTHLSQMGQEGNALYCFAKAHFISKNAINTLRRKEYIVNTACISSQMILPTANNS